MRLRARAKRQPGRWVWMLMALLGSASARAADTPLMVAEVLGSITNQYPPLLASLIERDIAAGRLQSARGAFDFNAFARLFSTPAGYYERTTWDTGFEQFTGIWGSTIFGGYRVTLGDTLPDYDSSRTQGGGEPRIGVRVPLLRDGSIDRRRATLSKARLDQELAHPVIARQRLDFVRAGTVAYFGWLAAGRRWMIAEELLRLANDRASALTNQAQSGLIPRIVLTDNRRLIVARQIGVVQARRRFENAAIALSLFHRRADGEPSVAGRERIPGDFPEVVLPDSSTLVSEVVRGMDRRPELRRLQLSREKLAVDLRLARNQLRPQLDAGATVSQDYGARTYKDKSELEVQAGIEFRMPLQRREARGRVTEVEGQLEQLARDEQFARERIRTEIHDAFSALSTAHEQIQQTRLNVELASELQSAEEERFRRGAADLLALQLRELAAFEARTLAVDAQADFFRAQADFRAASAAEAP